MGDRNEDTRYGFIWGCMEVSRCCSDKRRGWKLIQLKTPKGIFDVYFTKTGKVRFFKNGDEYQLVLKRAWSLEL